MKKSLIAVLLMAALLLSACGQIGSRGLTDEEMATRVALVLTTMPTATGQAQVEPTSALPTLPPVVVLTATPEVIATQPEATLEPTATETELPTLTATPDPGTPTATLAPSPTLPEGDPRLKLGNPKATDPMSNADKWTWPTGESDFTSVSFTGSKMTLTGLSEDAGWRLPLLPSLKNFYVEMTAITGKCSGRDAFGIIFRVPDLRDADQGYLFSISCDGQYRLSRWNGKAGDNGESVVLQNWKANKAILGGEGKTNRLGVWVDGSTIMLYANGVKLGEYTDATYKEGNFGIFINPDQTKEFSVQIDEISYWDALK